MSVNGGLVDPKERPKGVSDGQQVNIPALLHKRYYQWGDGACQSGPDKDLGSKSKIVCTGKSVQTF